MADERDVSLAQARSLVEKRRNELAMGVDPLEKKAELKSVLTVFEFIHQKYLPHVQLHKRSWKTDECLLRNHIEPRWGKRYMDEITLDDLTDLITAHRKTHAPGSCNRLIILARYLFNLALRWKMAGLKANPTAGFALLREDNKKERFLTAEEAGRLLTALQGSDNPMLLPIATMLMVTGARKREVLEWAVVDWIKLRVVTSRPSNFDTARRRMGIAHADPIEASASHAANGFIVTIQDPGSWADIERRLEAFTWDHPLAEPVVVTAIEVALDVYCAHQDRWALVDMVCHLYAGAAFMASSNRRLQRFKGESWGIGSRSSLRWHVSEGFNVYVGDQGAALQQHLYLKDTDTVDGQRVALPCEQQRARSEATLRGSQLPCVLLADWKGYDFAEMASLFRYRRLREDLNPMVACALESLDQFGERRPRPTRNRRPRFFSKATKADTVLNAKVYEAFRALDVRMKS